jgi:hypothetical protein
LCPDEPNAPAQIRKEKLLRKKRPNLYCLFLLTSVVGFFALAAETTLALNVSISPPRWEIEVEPGGHVEGSFAVTGAADRDFRVKIYFQDWVFNRRGEVEFLPTVGPRSVVSWLQIEPAEMIIPAGEERIFRIFGAVPPETAGGDYWSGFFVETVPEVPQEGSGMVVTGRVGGGVFLTVRGEAEKAGRIKDFTVEWENGLSGRVLFVNSGVTQLHPSGRVEIRDSRGKTVKRFSLPETVVLPGGEREMVFAEAMSLPAGDYVVLAILDYGSKKLLGAQALLKVDVPEEEER